MKKLFDELSVSAQIVPGDNAARKEAGFRAIICNRPDGEAADQASAKELETAASASALEHVYLPVVSGVITDDDDAKFGRLLKNLPKPILAYCRTGTRSASLWCLANASTQTLQTIANVWSLGDVCSVQNAKTAAAVGKQAPIVAENMCVDMGIRPKQAVDDSYGSCPLTVEHGKIALAEFGYGGKPLLTFPAFLLNGKKPIRRAWWLKDKILPPVYWHAMLKGKEWMAAPETH